jgi:hypothetical protein
MDDNYNQISENIHLSKDFLIQNLSKLKLFITYIIIE